MKHTIGIVLTLLITAVALFFVSPVRAAAGYDVVGKTFSIDSGSSFTTIKLPIERSAVVQIISLTPTLDSETSCTISAKFEAFGGSYSLPGWTDVVVNSAQRNAPLALNSTLMEAISPGILDYKVTLNKNQTAKRTFKAYFLLKN